MRLTPEEKEWLLNATTPQTGDVYGRVKGGKLRWVANVGKRYQDVDGQELVEVEASVGSYSANARILEHDLSNGCHVLLPA